MEFDDAMQKDEQMREELAGTTAITVLVKENTLYCVCPIIITFNIDVIAGSG
jgi:hypothetical protein